MTYFYDHNQSQGAMHNWQTGQANPFFSQPYGSWFGNPGMAAQGQHFGLNSQHGGQPALGAYGHYSGWGTQPQWGMQSPWGQMWGQQRQLSPYEVNEVVRQLAPALPQIIAQVQQPYAGLGYAAHGSSPRTLTQQDVNDVVRQLLPLVPQIAGALQGQPQYQFAMHGGGMGGLGHFGQHHLGPNLQNPFGMQNPYAALFQQPFQQAFQQPWQQAWGGQLGQFGAPQFQSAFGGPQQWGQPQRQLTQQDVAEVSRQLVGLIPQVISNLQALNQQRMI
jgi:hypothetical protein